MVEQRSIRHGQEFKPPAPDFLSSKNAHQWVGPQSILFVGKMSGIFKVENVEYFISSRPYWAIKLP